MLAPQVQQDLAARAPTPAQDQQQVAALAAQIDLRDSNSIIFFGSKAQEQLTAISDNMLEGVRNKDAGPAGAALNEMVSVLRGFNLEELDPNKKPGFFDRLFGKATPLTKIVQQYELVRNQIDSISDALERHKTQLLTDIAALDRLYAANLDYFHNLELYIAAGEAKLKKWTPRNCRRWSRKSPLAKRWSRRKPCAICAPVVTIWNGESMICN